MKRYRKIYALLEERKWKVPGFVLNDQSYWKLSKQAQTYIARTQPLWIVAEDPQIGCRIWITETGGRYGITTAQLNLKVGSRAYSDSVRRWTPRTQSEAVQILHQLFHKEMAA